MTRIFLVDDHPVLRAGLRLLLANHAGLSVVGEAGSGAELLEQLPATPADVVLLDILMPGLSGFETVLRLAEQYPAVRVLVLTVLTSADNIHQLLGAGVQGYILKSAGIEEIVHGIRMVAAGKPFLCSEVSFEALRRTRAELPLAASSTGDKLALAALSRREIEVLQLIAAGLTNGEIADKLFTSKRTIETHRQNIIRKTQMKNTASLIHFAVSEGLVS